MRTTIGFSAVIGVGLAVTACASDDAAPRPTGSVVAETNSASPTTGDAVDEEPIETLTSPPDSTPATTSATDEAGELLDILAALDKAGVECIDPMPVAADPESLDFGLATPEAAFECTSPDIGKVGITRWIDGTTMRGTMRVAVELSAAFGQDVSQFKIIVLDDRTLLGSESDETTQSAAVLEWLERAHGVVGGDILTVSQIIGD